MAYVSPLEAPRTDPEPEAAPVKPKRVSFAHRLWTGEMSFNFVGHSRWFYLLSAVLIIIAVASMSFRGFALGIEFRGGSNFTVSVTEAKPDPDRYRVAVLDSGVPNLEGTTVTLIGTNRVSVETRPLVDQGEQAEVRQAIAAAAGVPEEQVNHQSIGPSWGQQVTRQASIAVVVFLVLVGVLMAAYFRNWKMSVAAIIALIHDLVITVGLYALAGFFVTPAALTGLLTILGYSLYDNVVVFDKVRENAAELDDYRETYAEIANRSVNQVLVRSINTTVIGVLPVAAILFAGHFILGSGPLEDIGLALFVGMIIGAYSSIFLATPLLVRFKMAEPAMKLQAQRVAKRREKQEKIAAAVMETPAVVPAETYATYTVENTIPKRETAPGRQQPVKAPRSKRKDAS